MLQEEIPTERLSSSETSSKDEGDDDDEDYWYEKPDWAKVLVTDGASAASSNSVSYLSPQHHSILGLQESARR